MITAILGVLKAGCAYVPLDPSYPADRLRFMLEDSAPVALLTQTHLGDMFRGLNEGLPILNLAETELAWRTMPETNPDPASIGLGPHHIAYLIYTSGSTGAPKGVMVEHRNAIQQIATVRGEYQFSSEDRVLQFASINFDASIEEIFGALLSGAVLVLRDDSWLTGAREFWAMCSTMSVTVVDLPTRFWEFVCEEGSFEVPSCVRLIIIGGEVVERRALDRWFQHRGHRPKLLNTYGPTETTINATIGEMTSENLIWQSIGRPIPNTRVYILDGQREPVPIGVTGELHIGGAGVARGYLDRPELTTERFLADPFSSDLGARMYRTGDLGRWRPDGSIEFVGRNDFQVKIRGFRIELGEVEAGLVEHDAVREAVVIAREDTPGEKRLVAYYTASLSGAAEENAPEQLRSHLSAKLPAYMVPAAYVRMGSLPLMPNGKLDREALPRPEAEAYAGGGYEAPRGETEAAVAAIWADLLRVERVGRNENFFSLGGHSLSAVKLLSRINEQFGINLKLPSLFGSPTLAKLSGLVESNGNAKAEDEPAAEPPRMFPIVLPIRTSGNGHPLFCIHPAGGVGSIYAPFQTCIDPAFPIYAIQARGLDPHEPAASCIEEMADDYAEILMREQPTGPYRLLGWSFGGIVAHATAVRLQQRTGRVGLLAIMDGLAPSQEQPIPSEPDIVSTFARFIFGNDPDYADTTPPEFETLEQLLSYCDKHPGHFEVARELPILRLAEFLRCQCGFAQNYQSPVFEGDVLFFEATQLDPGQIPTSVGWDKIVSGRIERIPVDSHHMFMMQPEPLALIGQVLNAQLGLAPVAAPVLAYPIS
jgi:amino acid adenylation domain-containing protein